MSFKDLFALQTVLLILTVSNGTAKGNQKCYVCVPKSGPSTAEVMQMFPEGPPVPSCDLFDEVQTFVRECPLSANYGCLTQIQGKKMTKTCSDIDIEDCKTANKVKYCYCKGDLCNRERESLEEIGDDEDFGTDKLSQEEQGSGFSATVAEDDDDALLSRGIFTTSESNFSTTTTETNILATTTFSFEEKTLNVSSRLKKLDLLILILFVVLYLLR